MDFTPRGAGLMAERRVVEPRPSTGMGRVEGGGGGDGGPTQLGCKELGTGESSG